VEGDFKRFFSAFFSFLQNFSFALEKYSRRDGKNDDTNDNGRHQTFPVLTASARKPFRRRRVQ